MERNQKLFLRHSILFTEASEFSLLDAGVASKTNELAQRWLNIKPTADKILIKSSASNKIATSKKKIPKPKSLGFGRPNSVIGTITQDFQERVAINEGDSNKTPENSTTVALKGKKLGKALLQKMNIKPATSPNSSNAINPFFDPESPNKGKLILSSVPPLPYDETDETTLRVSRGQKLKVTRLLHYISA